jgi:hypothetical protein
MLRRRRVAAALPVLALLSCGRTGLLDSDEVSSTTRPPDITGPSNDAAIAAVDDGGPNVDGTIHDAQDGRDADDACTSSCAQPDSGPIHATACINGVPCQQEDYLVCDAGTECTIFCDCTATGKLYCEMGCGAK